MKLFYPAIFMLCFSACGTRLNYVGESRTPTAQVEVFVDANSIKRPYTIMGKGYLIGTSLNKSRYEILQKKAVKKARANGADAVLFSDYLVEKEGVTVNRSVHSQKTDSTTITTDNSVIESGPAIYTEMKIYFIRYE